MAIWHFTFIFSPLIIIGLPVIVTQMLAFDGETANRLYGYAEGVMALGSLCGGMGAGMLARKMKARNGYLLLFYSALTLIPMGLTMLLPMPVMVAYIIIMVSCFVLMFLATLFSIQLMSYLQIIVPADLVGKIISCAMCIAMCASPIGQTIYGGLFEGMRDCIYLVFFVATALTVLLAFGLKKSFAQLEKFI